MTSQRCSPNQKRSAEDEAATRYFKRLVFSADEFGLVHASDYQHQKWFPVIDIHGTFGRSIWIYERKRTTSVPAQ